MELSLSVSHCLSLTISQGFCDCLSHALSPKSVSLLTQGVLRRRGEIPSIRFSPLSSSSSSSSPSSLPKLTHKQVNAHNRNDFPTASPARRSVDEKRRTEIDNKRKRSEKERDTSHSYLQNCGASDADSPLSLAFILLSCQRSILYSEPGSMDGGRRGGGLNQFQIIAPLNN